MEVGVWIRGLGHGSVLAHEAGNLTRKKYIKQAGVLGECFEHGYCPLDDEFTEDYMQVVTSIAKLNPDLIMVV